MPNDQRTYAPERELEQIPQQSQPFPDGQQTESGAEKRPAGQEPKAHKRRKFIILAVIAGVAAGVGVWWLHARRFENTDDAQVDGHLSALAARIAGTVIGVYVEENEFVQKGQVVADLDPRDEKVALEIAQSQLTQARAESRAERPNVPVTQVTTQTTVTNADQEITNAEASVAAADQNYQAALARVREAQANNAKAQADVDRYRPLAEKDEVAQEQFAQVVATAQALAATVAANQASAQAALQQSDQSRVQLAEARTRAEQARKNAPQEIDIREANVAARQAAIQAAQAQVDQARLNLSYCTIIAPVGGIVAKRTAEVGQHVAPGQEIVLITQIDDLWVTANYKETQIRRMRPGQSVRIHVDALGKDYPGYIEGMPAASGSITSLLPPENATGNFVKVVQRMPVRIRFKKDQEGLDRLRPGMSVEPEVTVE